jgi:hypothetical protein
MINAPPDPAASLEAEQRSEDDGMPEHPAKAADPVAWADDHIEREKAAAAGYPTTTIGQAWADLMHDALKLIERVRPTRKATAISAASVVVGMGAGLAFYALYLRDRRPRYW